MALCLLLLNGCCNDSNGELKYFSYSKLKPQQLRLIMTYHKCVGGHDLVSAIMGNEISVMHYIVVPNQVGKYKSGDFKFYYGNPDNPTGKINE
jgi:hypothetical protein